MKITLTRTAGGHAKGATIERNTKVAAALINAGAAVEAEQVKTTKADDDKPKTKRTRRSQSRDEVEATGGDSNAKTDADKPAGQRGGGVPPVLPAPTAG